MKVIIGIGANLGDKEANIKSAISFIEKQTGKILGISKLYRSKALVLPGVDDSSVPDYINAAVLVETEILPSTLLEKLNDIERLIGRDRSKESFRWESRLIDLDIIAIDDLIINLPNLVVPHAEMHKRSFVLKPFADLWPSWKHPILGKNIEELIILLESSESTMLKYHQNTM